MDWIRIGPSALENRVEVGLGVGHDSFPGGRVGWIMDAVSFERMNGWVQGL